MAPGSPLKVGFIGLSSKGWASDVLGPAITQPSLRETYDLIAVSTTSETSAQASADKYSNIVGHPIKAYYGHTSKIASDPDVDVVGVAVKVTSHKDAVLPVIEAKKDFWLEWPAGRNTAETKEMAEAARKNGVRSIIGFQGRYTPTIRKVKELLASGAIGTIRSSHVIAHIGKELSLWPPVIMEGNPYGTLPLYKENGLTRLHVPIGHHLDMFTYVLGDFASVSATDATIYPTGTFVDAEGKPTGKTMQSETPDHFAITGLLKTGILVNLFWRDGYSSGPETGRRQFTWEIDGEEGTIRMEGSGLYGAFASMQEPEVFLKGKKVELEAGNVLQSAISAWSEFAKGEKGNYATIHDAVKHHELLDAIELSAKDGRRINL